MNAINHVAEALRIGQRYGQHCPAHHITGDCCQLDDVTVFYGDEACALGAGLAGMAALKVAWENDVRLFVQHACFVNVP